MFKKIITLSLSSALLLSTFAIGAERKDKVTVTIDGEEIKFDVEPQIIDDRTMVPMRKIFEKLGATVKWNDDTQTASARRNSKTVSMTINSSDMTIDKGDVDADGNSILETVTVDVPAQLISDRTLVPLRAISEAFNKKVEWDENSKTVSITSNEDEEDTSFEDNIGSINLDDMTYTGKGISVSDNKITITEGGDFTVEGTLDDGSITVSADKKVKLRLNGASITSSNGPCIYFENASKAFITIEDGTENLLHSTNSEKGTLYSKEDLEIKGSGKLSVISDTDHAIQASDNLTIENGILDITSLKDGISVNDTFEMSGGDVTISAVGDGIASESIVKIEGGNINVETTAEPIKTNATAAAETTETTDTQTNFRRPMFEEDIEIEFESSSKGIKADWMLVISGGEINVNSADHAIHCEDEIQITGGNLTLSSTYGKGISGHGNVTVDGDETVIDVLKSTEGLESKNILTINSGTIDIVASDDAINSGGTQGIAMGGGERPNKAMPIDGNTEQQPQQGMMPNGGTRPNREMMMPDDNMQPNPEAIPGGEMARPWNRGQRGEFTENPQDMQAMPPMAPEGAPPQGEFGNRGGMGMGRADLKTVIIINGGDIEAVAKDDCLDANGNIILNGGVIKAVRPNGEIVGVNGVIDADGSVTIAEEVTLIAAGNGSAPRLGIKQNYIICYLEEIQSAETKVLLKDSNDNTVASYSPNGEFKTLYIASPKLKGGKDYILAVGDAEYTVTVSGQETTIGTVPQQGNYGNRGIKFNRDAVDTQI